MGHVAAPEPTSAGRRGPELRNTLQRRSSTNQGGEARGHGPRGSTGAHLSKVVRSGAAGHVAALKPTSAGKCGPNLQLAWQRVDARPTPCFDLELVCGGTRSSGCRQAPCHCAPPAPRACPQHRLVKSGNGIPPSSSSTASTSVVAASPVVPPPHRPRCEVRAASTTPLAPHWCLLPIGTHATVEAPPSVSTAFPTSPPR
jgi:hypothetical protein